MAESTYNRPSCAWSPAPICPSALCIDDLPSNNMLQVTGWQPTRTCFRRQAIPQLDGPFLPPKDPSQVFQTTRDKEMGTTLLNSDSGVAPGEQQCGTQHGFWRHTSRGLVTQGTEPDGTRHGVWQGAALGLAASSTGACGGACGGIGWLQWITQALGSWRRQTTCRCC